MRKRFYLLITIPIAFSFFLFFLFGNINKNSENIDDEQLTTLVQKTNYPSNQNFEKIITSEKRTFDFTAKYDNLGIVSFLFNNYEKDGTNHFWLRVKEKDSENWLYQEKYDNKKINSNYYYTFGFPIINDSKNKEYFIEIESTDGNLENSISLNSNSDFFITKYSYSKSYLLNNPNQIVPFIKNKIKNQLGYFDVKNLNTIIYKSILFSLISLFFINIYIKSGGNSFHKDYLIFKNRKKSIIKYGNIYFSSPRFFLELLVIFTPIILLFDFAYFSPATSMISFSFYFLFRIILLNLCYLYLFYKVVFFNKLNIKKLIQPFWIPVFLFIILRSFFLDAIPRWDSAEYYQSLLNSIYNFDFSFSSFMFFNWFNHPSMGFGLFSAIFQFPNPDNIIMLNIGNMVLGIIAIISFYLICLYFFGKKRKIEIVLLTILFALNPLFFAISTAFVPDFGVLVFFLAASVSFFYKKPILASFFFLLLIFSKEIGVYSYLLFILFYFLFVIIKKLRTIKSSYLFDFLCIYIPGFLYFIYCIYTRGKHWGVSNTLTADGNCFFCFSFQPSHFIQNLNVMFILSFSWILSLVIILAFVKYLLNRSSSSPIKEQIKKDEFKSLVFVFLGFVIFFIFYVIYIIPRYLLFSVFFLILIFYYALLRLISNYRIRLIVLISVGVLLMIQNFNNIDPISSRVFGTFNFGNYQGLRIGTEYFCDGQIYNTQYVYIDRLINKFNVEFKISPQDNVFMNSKKWENFYLGEAGYDLYLDKDSRKKTFNQKNSFRPKLGRPLFSSNAYYLSFPWLENEAVSLDLIGQTYKIGKKTEIKINGYWLNAYSLTEKYPTQDFSPL